MRGVGKICDFQSIRRFAERDRSHRLVSRVEHYSHYLAAGRLAPSGD